MRRLPVSLFCAFLFACDPTPQASACGPETCGGCCAGDRCELGQATAVCGLGGATCQACSAGLVCSLGVCGSAASTGGGGGAVGGGAGGGSVGGGAGGGSMGGGAGGGSVGGGAGGGSVGGGAGGGSTGGGAGGGGGTGDAGIDAGVRDAGIDAGVRDAGIDAGVRDAGIDAGMTPIPGPGFLPDGGLALRIFTSSGVVSGDLLGQGGGTTGVLGGDLLCQEFADAVALGGQWSALVATPTTHAFNRLPASGPWVIAGTTTVAFPNRASLIFPPPVPLNVSERGLPVGAPLEAWTGATSTGGVGTWHCSDWTSYYSNTSGVTGSVSSTTSTWISYLSGDCGVDRHLYCFEQSRPDGGVVPALPPKRVFVTSQAFSGDLKTQAGAASGVAGGDALCQTTADARSLGGTWKAYLATPTHRASSSFTHPGPWTLMGGDGGVLFANLAALAVGVPSVPIDHDELGQPVGTQEVWTGSDFGGYVSYFDHCGSWTEPYGNTYGLAGTTASTTRWRTNVSSGVCGTPRRLYCFEQ